jgi:hypothetical protein
MNNDELYVNKLSGQIYNKGQLVAIKKLLDTLKNLRVTSRDIHVKVGRHFTFFVV